MSGYADGAGQRLGTCPVLPKPFPSLMEVAAVVRRLACLEAADSLTGMPPR
jgi:hypothetical protein